MLRDVAFTFITLLAVVRPAPGAAQVRAEPSTPTTAAADSLELVTLARQLTQDATTDSARAAAIYAWVAQNVAYDLDSYRLGSDGYADPIAVYRHRRAVCKGYVALFARLATEAGLVTVPIRGYAKGFDYVYGMRTKKPNHVWLAVSNDGRWRLVDPTWGAGTVAADGFRPAFSWDYFFVDPDVLLLSHFPLESEWQFVEQPLRRAEFERMPPIPSMLVRVGFRADSIRALTLRSGVRDFPTVGLPSPSMRIVHAPLSGTILRSASVPVQIAWPDAADVVVVNGNVWTPLTRAGDTFHGVVTAMVGPLYVAGRTSLTQPYQTLLLYQVN